MNRYHIRKRIATIKKYQRVLLGASDSIVAEAQLLREDCHDTFMALWKQHGLQGQPESTNLAFQGGILAKKWKPGAFMVFEDTLGLSCMDFCDLVAKIAPAFYRQTGIKLCVWGPGGKSIHLPKGQAIH